VENNSSVFAFVRNAV